MNYELMIKYNSDVYKFTKSKSKSINDFKLFYHRYNFYIF